MNIKRTHPEVYEALEQTGLDWEVKPGGRHWKIVLGGRLTGILPRGSGSRQKSHLRAMKNVVSQIRRTATELQ